MKLSEPTLDLPYSDIFPVSVIYLVPVKLLKTHRSLADMLLKKWALFNLIPHTLPEMPEHQTSS